MKLFTFWAKNHQWEVVQIKARTEEEAIKKLRAKNFELVTSRPQ